MAGFGYLALVIAVLVSAPYAARGESAPGFFWARSAGGISNEVALAIAADPSGNVLLAGYFNGSITLGGSNLVSSGLEDIFLAKYDPEGSLAWVRKAGGVGYDEARGVATDPSGNIYITGLFQDTASFGTSNIISAGLSDVFIAKYAPNGTLLWVIRGGGNDYDEAHAIAVDPAGNAYITGFFDATASFGSSSLPNHTLSDDVFVAKCSSSGSFLWARQAGGDLDDAGNGIALDGATNVYVVGAFTGSATFGVNSLTGMGTNNLPDLFLSKYNSGGNLLWVRQAGGEGDDAANAIVADAAGNVALTGRFAGPATFGNYNITGSGTDIFVSRYDTSGNCLWARRAGGNNSIYGDSGLGLGTDSAGNIFATGYFSGTSSFGSTNIQTRGFDDVFCSKYDSGGNLLWVRTAGGANLDLSYGIAVDQSGNVMLAGFFASSTIAFDGVSLTNSGGRDIFVAKLRVVPEIQPTLSLTLSNGQSILSWPAAANSYQLQINLDLATVNWSTLPDQGTIIGTNRVATFPMAGPRMFFRLWRQ